MEKRNLGFQRATRPSNPSYSSSSLRAGNRRRTGGSAGGPSGWNSSMEESGSPDATPLAGACPDMCPARERAQRERLRDLAVFERLDGNPARTSASLAVKKFCRTISSIDVQTSDIRPLPVLEKTMKYLFSLLDCPEYPYELVHDFVFDRTRSIRQDLSIQNIVNDQAIQLYEDMVRFHIISHQRLARCVGTPGLPSLCHLNIEQLMKCLLSLYNMYAINKKFKSANKNEAEYYSFYVLLHLGSKIPKMGDSLSLWYRQLALPTLQSKEMRFARTLLRFSHMGNYKRLFSNIAAEASDLQSSLLEPFLNEVRAQAILYINYSGYKLHPYPLRDLCKILMIKEPELESLCLACCLEVCTDEAGIKSLPAKQNNFTLPKSELQSYSLYSN